MIAYRDDHHVGRVIRPLRPDRLPYWAEERADGVTDRDRHLAHVVVLCVAAFALLIVLLALVPAASLAIGDWIARVLG